MQTTHDLVVFFPVALARRKEGRISKKRNRSPGVWWSVDSCADSTNPLISRIISTPQCGLQCTPLPEAGLEVHETHFPSSEVPLTSFCVCCWCSEKIADVSSEIFHAHLWLTHQTVNLFCPQFHTNDAQKRITHSSQNTTGNHTVETSGRTRMSNENTV